MDKCMCTEIFGWFKPCLYKIYQFVVGNPNFIFTIIWPWFVLCGIMDGVKERLSKRNLFRWLWNLVVSSVLLGSIIMFIYVTLGNRYQESYTKFKLELFWSYKEIIYNKNKFMLWQVLWNIIAFLPIGNALYYLLHTKKKLIKVVLICALLSTSVELIQLFGRFGLFEFDDIFDNTLGAMLGAWFAELLYKIRKLLYSTCTSRKHLL